MNGISKTRAQQRADHIRIFREELGRLEDEGVVTLSAEQREAIGRHHDALLAGYAQAFDIDRDPQAKQLSLGMRVASFLGALALAASVFFLFNQYWGLFPTTVQVVLLIAASLVSVGATFWVGQRDASGYFAKLAAMAAFACFVLNVALLGEMFNITPSNKAFAAWAALALLLAYTFDLRLLLVAGILCIIRLVSVEVDSWSGIYRSGLVQRLEHYLPAGMLLLLVPAVFSHDRFNGFASVYRLFGLLTLLVPILLLAHWGYDSYLPFSVGVVESVYQVLGFLLCAAAIWWGARREHPEALNTGIAFFVIFLYSRFYDWWWKIMPRFVFFLIIALTAIVVILVMKRLRARTRAVGGGQ